MVGSGDKRHPQVYDPLNLGYRQPAREIGLIKCNRDTKTSAVLAQRGQGERSQGVATFIIYHPTGNMQVEIASISNHISGA